MRRILLDTHVFLWYFEGDNRMPRSDRDIAADMRNELSISICSFFELAIKKSIGKLGLDRGVEEYYNVACENGLHILPISIEALQTLETLPLLHRDPFDRIIVSEAIAGGLTIMTADENIAQYPVNIVF